MTEPIVITGVGAVLATGIGVEPFWDVLCKSQPPETFVASNGGRVFRTPRITGEHIGTQKHLNLQYMSRSSLMVCAATGMARLDADAGGSGEKPERRGIVMGTDLGSTQAMIDFNAELDRKGPVGVNPVLFPESVSNAPASHAAIAFGLEGINVTVSTGCSSGIEAMRFATELLETSELDYVFSGGYDELCPSLCSVWNQRELVSLANLPVPFDHGRTGFTPGEGSLVFVLEKESRALSRRVHIYGSILGYGAATPLTSTEQELIEAQLASMTLALDRSGATISDLACIFASANGDPRMDNIEAHAIMRLAGDKRPAITAVKAYIGECGAAAGPAGVAAALLCLQNDIVAGVPSFERSEAGIQIDVAPGVRRPGGSPLALINAFGHDGAGYSVVVRTGRNLE